MEHEETMLALLEEHGPALRRIAGAYAGADGDGEDLYQEILAQVWRSLPSFRGEAALKSWSFRIAVNTALTWRRRATNHSRGGPPRNVPSPPPEPHRASGRSQAAILSDFLATLGSVDHTVLLLYMEGLSHEEISTTTGLSPSAVGVRIHRMRKAFLKRYVEE